MKGKTPVNAKVKWSSSTVNFLRLLLLCETDVEGWVVELYSLGHNNLKFNDDIFAFSSGKIISTSTLPSIVISIAIPLNLKSTFLISEIKSDLRGDIASLGLNQ